MPHPSARHVHPSTTVSQQRSYASPPAAPSSIADTRLGLAPEDLATLRQHQQLARANARSPASSQASSQGRLLLDPGSLQMLSRHFDRVMQAIAQRLEQLHAASEHAMEAQAEQAATSIQAADAEIARIHAMMRQIDELENEFDKISRVREIVAGFRARVDSLERRLG